MRTVSSTAFQAGQRNQQAFQSGAAEIHGDLLLVADSLHVLNYAFAEHRMAHDFADGEGDALGLGGWRGAAGDPFGELFVDVAAQTATGGASGSSVAGLAPADAGLAA